MRHPNRAGYERIADERFKEIATEHLKYILRKKNEENEHREMGSHDIVSDRRVVRSV